MLNNQNNYVGNSSIMLQRILTLYSNYLERLLHDYFYNPMKLFLDLHLAKFLNILTKSNRTESFS